MKARITRTGAILLGKYVACDGFDEQQPIRVVTHVHADHMLGLRESLKKCEMVLMSEATKDLIDVLKSPLFLMAGNVKTLPYEEPFEYKNEKITFYPADHILGSTQVLVEDQKGERILYTSDFRLPNTPIIRSDILVIEATYGSPRCVRNFEQKAESVLVDLVDRGLCEGPVYLFGYHGKIQEVMEILWKNNIRVPFIVPEKVFHVCKVYEKHNKKLGRYWLARSEYAKELRSKKEPFVAFYHMAARRRFIKEKAYKIFVSGWQFQEPVRQVNEKGFVIAISDHSDFEGLIEYVRKSKPKLVLTDNYRIGHAKILAKEIEKRLGIKAIAVPPTKPKKK